MSGNNFGTLFKISTFGESHGPGIGAIIDGCPSNIPLTESDIQVELDRRKPGQSDVTTPRKENDTVEILSGTFEGKTTGAPIGLLIRNQNQRSKDYSQIKDLFRPGHADYTYQKKYQNRDYRGGGRSSGRETASRVAAGAIAKKVLESKGIQTIAYTIQVGDIKANERQLSEIELNAVRCPDKKAAVKMTELIKDIRGTGDSIGGIVEAIITGLPVGIGEPCFDKLDAKIAHAILSIATTKGIEFGNGFNCATQRGSQSNDEFTIENNQVRTKTNHSGGILGGISNGETILLRVAVKAPSSISIKQDTINKQNKKTSVEVHGRHDPCICPRVVPVVEAMLNIVVLDYLLINNRLL